MNFTQFATKHGYPSDYDIMDHSTLSPSGKVSERSRKASIKRLEERIAANREAHREYEKAILQGEIIDPSGQVTKEDLEARIQREADKKVAGRISQIDAQIRFLSDTGQGKRGIKPSYQKRIDVLTQEQKSLLAEPASRLTGKAKEAEKVVESEVLSGPE